MGSAGAGRLSRGFLALAGAALMMSGCMAGTAPGTAAPAPAAASSSAPPAGAPPSEAAMVCGDEISARIAQILTLGSAPARAQSWAEGLYTCAYRLPEGSLALLVKEFADPAAARTYAASVQQRLPGAAPIEGLANLGLPAYQSPAGAVVFVKDSFTLTVDATGLGEKVGPQGISRSAFAYQIATDVLACWRG